MSRYTITLEDNVIDNDIPRLSKALRQRIKKAVRERLTEYPEMVGKPLRHNWKGHFSLRVGDYRVIYRIDGKNMIVHIVAIQHRSYVYE
ncbi:MAG: type II toxin-antitoxin system RelE family toxin [Bdellovibrionales bacterium]